MKSYSYYVIFLHNYESLGKVCFALCSLCNLQLFFPVSDILAEPLSTLCTSGVPAEEVTPDSKRKASCCRSLINEFNSSPVFISYMRYSSKIMFTGNLLPVISVSGVYLYLFYMAVNEHAGRARTDRQRGLNAY